MSCKAYKKQALSSSANLAVCTYIANAKKLKRYCPTIHPYNNHHTYSTAPPQKVIAGIAAATSRLSQRKWLQIKSYHGKYFLDLRKQQQRLLRNFHFLGYYYILFLSKQAIRYHWQLYGSNQENSSCKKACQSPCIICLMLCLQDRGLICILVVYSLSDTPRDL